MRKYTPANIVVHNTYLTDYQLWIYFLHTYRPLIRSFSIDLERSCYRWTGGWQIHLDRHPHRHIPTLMGQKQTIFGSMPYLESVWVKWTQNIDRSRSPRLNMDI